MADTSHIPTRFDRYVCEAEKHVYALIEYCAFIDSLLSDRKYHIGLCRTVCINEEIDGRSFKAVELCNLVCKQDRNKVVLWGSLPCTGGCPWNHINALNPGGRERIEQHTSLMTQLLSRFLPIARTVKRNGGVIIFEWSLHCTYWKRADIQSIITELELHPTHIHGCSLGLKSIRVGFEHFYIKKPWAIEIPAAQISITH